MKIMIFAAAICASSIAVAQAGSGSQAGQAGTSMDHSAHSGQATSGQGSTGQSGTQSNGGSASGQPMGPDPTDGASMGARAGVGQSGSAGAGQGGQGQAGSSGNWNSSGGSAGGAGAGTTGAYGGMGGAGAGGTRSYPTCSRTVTDSCIQRNERGMRRR